MAPLCSLLLEKEILQKKKRALLLQYYIANSSERLTKYMLLPENQRFKWEWVVSWISGHQSGYIEAKTEKFDLNGSKQGKICQKIQIIDQYRQTCKGWGGQAGWDKMPNVAVFVCLMALLIAHLWRNNVKNQTGCWPLITSSLFSILWLKLELKFEAEALFSSGALSGANLLKSSLKAAGSKGQPTKSKHIFWGQNIVSWPNLGVRGLSML